MTEMATIEQKMRRTVQVRASFRMARKRLALRGNLLTLILSSLFLLVAAFAAYFVADLLAFVLGNVFATSEMLPDRAFYAALLLFALFFVSPLVLGYLRLAFFMAESESPPARELLYYMSTPKRYFKAVLQGLVCAFAVAVPVLLAGASLLAARLVSTEILASAMAADVAAQRVVTVYMLASLLAVLSLLLEAFALPVVGTVMNSEKRNPFAALLRGWRQGARHWGKNVAFLLQVLWRALLGLCTLGVLWLLWHGPLVSVAYAAYCEEILKEE